jgi:hypothetical protein
LPSEQIMLSLNAFVAKNIALHQCKKIENGLQHRTTGISSNSSL